VDDCRFQIGNPSCFTCRCNLLGGTETLISDATGEV